MQTPFVDLNIGKQALFVFLQRNPFALVDKRGFFDGGAYGTRTRDPDTASVVRSQLR